MTAAVHQVSPDEIAGPVNPQARRQERAHEDASRPRVLSEHGTAERFVCRPIVLQKKPIAGIGEYPMLMNGLA